MDYAQQLGDPRLLSYVLMRKSNIASDARDGEAALAFAGAALRDWGRLTPRLRAVALRQQAHGLALGGDAAACARTLDLAAEQLSAGRGDGPELDLTLYCTTSYLDMEAATCWTELGQPGRAVEALEHGLDTWRPEFRRDLGLSLARLAVAYAADSELDQSWSVAERALAIARETRSARAVRELTRLKAHFTGPQGHPAAGDLRQALVELRRS
jgi:hypothetical protein